MFYAWNKRKIIGIRESIHCVNSLCNPGFVTTLRNTYLCHAQKPFIDTFAFTTVLCFRFCYC